MNGWMDQWGAEEHTDVRCYIIQMEDLVPLTTSLFVFGHGPFLSILTRDVMSGSQNQSKARLSTGLTWTPQ